MIDERPFITGYTDRLSGIEGENISFRVSCSAPMELKVELVRIICGDMNPQGPGLKIERVQSKLSRVCRGERQITSPGSFGLVPLSPAVFGLSSFFVGMWVMPTTVHKGQQIIFSQFNRAGATFDLGIDTDGSTIARLVDTAGEIFSLTTRKTMHNGGWYYVSVSYDQSEGRVILRQQPQDKMLGNDIVVECPIQSRVDSAELGEAVTTFAARIKQSAQPKIEGELFFNGRIEAPVIASSSKLDQALNIGDETMVEGLDRSDLLAKWDFGIGIDTVEITDLIGLGNGTVKNLPARGVTGHLWSGQTHRWKSDPSQYAAIHFHDDDLYDAGWPDTFAWTIEPLRSGLYAAHVYSDLAEDYLPFYIRTPSRSTKNSVVFLAPTASYMAYANDHSPTNAHLAEVELGQATVLSTTDLILNKHREFGASLYDTHSDGSGVMYSSRLRPILNMRPKLTGWLGGSGSSLWQFNADTHILDWLEAHDVSADVITDEDLHYVDGILDNYRVLVTGTHPEYFSKKMRDTVSVFLSKGGRLMYLGGNGWYWKIAFHKMLPGVIEVRRAESGLRAWESRPGEYYHSFDGEYGGLWRRQGHAPQEALGVGFSAQGFDVSSYYVRTEQSKDPRVRFMFEGIEGTEKIGNFGLTGGGAAGLELDRADFSLGTPLHALVVASSCGHTDTYTVVPEEILINTATYTGTQSNLVRSDLTFFETPWGGAVFSVGSIAWAGSLSHNRYDNNISRLTKNVLLRFRDSTPFTMPEI